MFDKEQKGSSKRALQFYGNNNYINSKRNASEALGYVFRCPFNFLVSGRGGLILQKLSIVKLLGFVHDFCRKVTRILLHVAGRTCFTSPREGSFGESGGGLHPLPLQGKKKKTDKMVYSSNIIRTSTFSQPPAQVPAVTPKAPPRMENVFPPSATLNSQR